MINRSLILSFFLLSFACQSQIQQKDKTKTKEEMTYKINKSETDWKKKLSPAQFHILREKGTERPGTGEYNLHFEKGAYVCAGCDTPLFESDNKYESHCGWPSFDDAIPGTVVYQDDSSVGMHRIEIVCANCGGHLGHIFDDGPQETTGKRYCVNSMSLEFKKEKE